MQDAELGMPAIPCHTCVNIYLTTSTKRDANKTIMVIASMRGAGTGAGEGLAAGTSTHPHVSAARQTCNHRVRMYMLTAWRSMQP